jgi:hypothetical protein
LVSWRINIELTQQVEQEKRILMALSQVYLEWEKQTKRLGYEEERRSTIENMLQLRFGSIDQDLQAIIPNMMILNNAEYTRLLYQLSREELIQHFQN